jgi:hypothetical protein
MYDTLIRLKNAGRLSELMLKKALTLKFIDQNQYDTLLNMIK